MALIPGAGSSNHRGEIVWLSSRLNVKESEELKCALLIVGKIFEIENRFACLLQLLEGEDIPCVSREFG
jgi:hypothetical protein